MYWFVTSFLCKRTLTKMSQTSPFVWPVLLHFTVGHTQSTVYSCPNSTPHTHSFCVVTPLYRHTTRIVSTSVNIPFTGLFNHSTFLKLYLLSSYDLTPHRSPLPPPSKVSLFITCVVHCQSFLYTPVYSLQLFSPSQRSPRGHPIRSSLCCWRHSPFKRPFFSCFYPLHHPHITISYWYSWKA